MSDNKETPSPSPPKDDVNNPDEIIKKEEEPKGNEASEASAAVEVYNPMFVPSTPPGIVSKKFKMNPQKWKRGYGMVFRNSRELHTSKLNKTRTLFVKDDEQLRHLDLTFLTGIFAKQRQDEFRTYKDINRKMRKYVMSKSVFNRCLEYEKKQFESERKIKLEQIENRKRIELLIEKERKDYDQKVAENIKNYVQFAPMKLCKSLRKGVCLWYKMMQFAKVHGYSASKRYIENEKKNLRELYDADNFDVDFDFYMGTLHVLFESSNLYWRYGEFKFLQKPINTKTDNTRYSFKTDGTSIPQVFDLINEQNRSQQEDQDNKATVEDMLNEMAELYKQIERSNEGFQPVPSCELMTSDSHMQEACNLFGDYLLRIYVNSTDVEDLAHDIKQIHLERAGTRGKIQLKFIDFFRQIVTITLASIAVDEDRTEWDKKTVEFLAALLESPKEIYDRKDYKPSRAFEDVPDKLIEIKVMTKSQNVQQDKCVQDAITVYTQYLERNAGDDEDCKVAVQVVDELKQIFEQFDNEDETKESFFQFFELVQNLSLTLIDDLDKWDAKTLKVLVVLLNGPVAQQHANAGDHAQEFKEQRSRTNIESQQ